MECGVWRRASSLNCVNDDAQRTPIPHQIRVLVAAAFIISLGFGLVSPIIPQFAQSFDVSVSAASFVISIFAATRLMFAPLSGRLIDALGSRWVYLTGLTTVAVGTGAIAFAQAYWHIVALRAISGVGSTMFTVSAMSLIVRIAPPHIRGRASSTYATAFLLGSVIGPVLGAVLSGLGMRTPFVIYAVMLILATVVVAVRLNAQEIKGVEQGDTQPPMRRREAFRDPTYCAALISGFAFGWSNFGVRIAVLPLFAAAVFDWGGAVAGLALAAYAVGNAVTLQISGELADTIGRRPLIIGGLIVNTLFTACIGFSEHFAVLLAVSVAAGVGAGLMNPAQQATIADIVGNQRAGGRVLAAYQMAQDFGVIVGPLVVGMIVDAHNYRPAFLSCGLIGLIAILVWIFLGRETAGRAAA